MTGKYSAAVHTLSVREANFDPYDSCERVLIINEAHNVVGTISIVVYGERVGTSWAQAVVKEINKKADLSEPVKVPEIPDQLPGLIREMMESLLYVNQHYPDATGFRDRYLLVKKATDMLAALEPKKAT